MKTKRPWLLVRNPEYFQGVLASLVHFYPDALHNPDVVVRFGLMGQGVHPNYQLEAPGGKVSARMGINHAVDHSAPNGRFNDDELSVERYNVVGARGLLERCKGIVAGTVDAGPDGEGP